MNAKYLLAKLIKKIHLPAINHSYIDKKSKICSGAQVNYCTIGRYSYIGNFTNINHVKIGSFCSVADRCEIGGGAHPLNWVSTSPVFQAGRNCMNKNFAVKDFQPYKETVIGNDVWIGTSVLIKGGVTVGDGAVIGMGSILTKDVGPYEIWGGNPARFIKKRFDEETVEKLLKTKWWEWDDDLIRKHSEQFDDIGTFLDGDYN